jgi:hypothetical protein
VSARISSSAQLSPGGLGDACGERNCANLRIRFTHLEVAGGKLLARRIDQSGRMSALDTGKEHHEFLAAEPVDQMALAGCLQHLGHRLQHAIADEMPMPVIDALKLSMSQTAALNATPAVWRASNRSSSARRLLSPVKTSVRASSDAWRARGERLHLLVGAAAVVPHPRAIDHSRR